MAALPKGIFAQVFVVVVVVDVVVVVVDIVVVGISLFMLLFRADATSLLIVSLTLSYRPRASLRSYIGLYSLNTSL